MTELVDQLAGLADQATQREAAGVAQDGFSRIFRLIADGDNAAAETGLAIIERRSKAWAEEGASDEANALRLALLISGLDQWGLAWTQAFELSALPGLTALLGNLRTTLDPQQTARFELQFAAIEAREENAIDFKVELRRGIHLALWHAMVASEDKVEASRLLQQLDGMMLALIQSMPTYGWRLVADALAHIQLRCLDPNFAADPDANSLAQETTQGLFSALSQQLPADIYKLMLAQATQVVLAYQSAQRQASGAE